MEKVKFQVPMDKKVYQKLKIRADELGFDSVQSYVRFWAKSTTSESREASDRILAQSSGQALRYLELVLAMAPEGPASVKEALAYIEAHLRRVKSSRYLDTLLKETHQI